MTEEAAASVGSKAALRAAALGRRAALSAGERQVATLVLAGHELPIAIADGAIVSGFMPLKDEIDPLPLMRRLAADGASLALPVVIRRGQPLTMRDYAFGDALASGQMGLREPLPSAPTVEPDILLVPLAAFDRRGHRIGYGAGYYDMTLAALRRTKTVTAIGVAFACQEIPRVPNDAHDEPLDLVLTEREVIVCGA